MAPDSTLHLVIEDLPGIGRRYEMTGTNGGRISSSSTTAGAASSTAATPALTRPRRWS
jgi:hypothetical protein